MYTTACGSFSTSPSWCRTSLLRFLLIVFEVTRGVPITSPTAPIREASTCGCPSASHIDICGK